MSDEYVHGKVEEALAHIKESLSLINSKLDRINGRVQESEKEIVRIKTVGSFLVFIISCVSSFLTKLVFR